MSEQPRPWPAGGLHVGALVLGVLKELELASLGGARGRRCGHPFSPARGVRREAPEVSDKVEAWGRDESDDAAQQVVGLEEDRDEASLQCFFSE